MKTRDELFDGLWRTLREAASQKDYGLARDTMEALHLTLRRPCASAPSGCTRLASERHAHCAQCWAKTPAGRASLGAAVADTLRSIAPVLADDFEQTVVATVEAEETPALPERCVAAVAPSLPAPAVAPEAPVKLTDAQRRALGEMIHQGPQYAYSRARQRVHNELTAKLLARPVEVPHGDGIEGSTTHTEVTDAGRAAYVATRSAREIAQRIALHLRRFEADPAINIASRSPLNLHLYYDVGAGDIGGGYVSVTYVRYQYTYSLRRSEALAYLAWLDAGNVGKHTQMTTKPDAEAPRAIETIATLETPQ